MERKQSNKLYKALDLDKEKVSLNTFHHAINHDLDLYSDLELPLEKIIHITLKKLSCYPNYYKKNKKLEKNDDLKIILNGGSFWDVVKNPISTIKEAFRGAPSKYSYGSQETLNKYGASKITGGFMARTPLNKVLTGAINALSFGKFDELVRKYGGFDKLFHVAIILNLDSGHKIIVEKNEVINIAPYKGSPSKTEFHNITLPRETLNDFIEKGRKYMGDDKWFSYNALNNNCQVFLSSLLTANNSYTEASKKFLFQDFSKVEAELQKGKFSYVPKVMNGITNLGSIVSRLTGRGTEDDCMRHFEEYLNEAGIMEGRNEHFIDFINGPGLKYL